MGKATVIAICNQKGGVGKSSTAIALTGGLHLAGKKALLIDCDAQGNSSYAFGVDTTGKDPDCYDVINGDCGIADAIKTTEQGDIIPNSPRMALLDREAQGNPDAVYKLKTALKPLVRKYDYIVLDTPPALSAETLAALTAADKCVICTEADVFSLQGLGQIYKTIKAVQEHSNKRLHIEGILITRFDVRTIISRDKAKVLFDTAKALDTKLFNKPIRECVAIKESHDMHQDIYTYAPKSNAAMDYANFVKDIMG